MYTYLIGSLIYLSLWFVIFIRRKDLRRNMLRISIPFSFIGLIMSALFYTKDWWTPKTVLGTPFGLEDMIFGFAMAGIGYSIYPYIYNEKEKEYRINKNKLILISSLMFLPGVILFLLGVNSSLSGLIPILFYLYFIRKRSLMKKALVTSFFLLLTAVIIYPFLSLLNPAFLEATFQFRNISGIVLFKAPLEDLLWFFYSGIFLGTIFDVIKE